MKGSLGSSEMLLDDTVTVVIIPGAGDYNAVAMEKWQDAFPGSVIIIPKEHWPLSSGAKDIARQMIEERITGKVVFVGLSFGGNLSREYAAKFPDRIVAGVTVGTPNTVKFMPEFPSYWSIRPSDGGSEVPLFAAVGVKPGAPKPVWMDEPSDGTIGLSQATDFKGRKVEEVAVFKAEHSELFEDDKVIEWAWEKLSPFLKPKSTLVASKAIEK